MEKEIKIIRIGETQKYQINIKFGVKIRISRENARNRHIGIIRVFRIGETQKLQRFNIKIDTLDGKMWKINCDIIIDKMIQIEVETKIKG